MGLLHYLFGFRGRINRAKQWAIVFVGLIHAVGIAVLFSGTVGFSVFAELFERKTTILATMMSASMHRFGVLFVALYAVVFYVGLAVSTKRLHDRDKSAWWLLIFIALPMVLNLPALFFLPHQVTYLGAVMRAAQEHRALPLEPLEPALVSISRGAATVVSLWAFVELYVLRGTVGYNRYGPDPLRDKALTALG